MSVKHFLFVTILVVYGSTVNADSLQTLDILNNSTQAMYLAANNADRSMCFTQTVPAHAKSLVVIQVTQLKSLQDMLFEAILTNSPYEIQKAIEAGANVNLERAGKRPLFWALEFNRMISVRCLLANGAV